MLPDAERHVSAPDELVGHQREAGGDAPPAAGGSHRALGGEAADSRTAERAAGATCEIIEVLPEGAGGRDTGRVAAARRRALPHRRRHRDDAHLPRGPRAARLRRLSSPRTPEGEAALVKYFRRYAEIAERYGAGLILESATWRASADWGAALGYSARSSPKRIGARSRCSRRSGARRRGRTADRDQRLRRAARRRVCGRTARCRPGRPRPTTASRSRRSPATDADMVCAITMNHVEEAGAWRAPPAAAGMPVAISFTVETDGRLPTGQTLGDAIGAGRRARARLSRVLHDQLRASLALRRRSRSRSRGPAAFAACGPTRRRRAMPSSTSPRRSTSAIRRSSAGSTRGSNGRCRRST